MSDLNLNKNSEPFIQKILSRYSYRNTSKGRRFFYFFVVTALGLILTVSIEKQFNFFLSPALVLVSVVATILSGPFLGISAILASVFLGTYFFIPSGLLSSQEDFVRIGFSLLLGAIMSLLVQSFMKQKEEAAQAKVVADKAKEEAAQAKVVADKAKEEAAQAKVVADRSLKQREDMVGVISHELKNPLTNMQLSLTLIQRILPKDPSLEKARLLIEKLGPSIQRMSKLVSDLLDVSRLEAKALIVEMRDSALNEITLNVIDAFKLSAQEKSLHLFSDIPTDCQDVTCDPDRTFQILSNLVSNAIKFTDSGGSISIHAEKLEHEIEVRVTDTGHGISDESLPHVFDRFWQEKSTAYIGTGLGLAISKGLVEAQGGKIWVKSQHGIGTTFYFTLLLSGHDKKFISVGHSISKGHETNFNGSSLS